MASTSPLYHSRQSASPLTAPYVTIFVCANCARAGRTAEAATRSRPDVPDFEWPFPAQEILLPCTGRLQPEHVLKAFESGARLVGVVACREDNCHHLEGSKRCARRVEYLQGILDEVGLGAERLRLLHLPGTAAEDMASGAGQSRRALGAEDVPARVAAIREAIVESLRDLTPTPLDIPVTEAAADPYQQADTDYGDSED